MLYPNPQIYSQLKTIFVHVPKTAGTSIERTLDEHCGISTGGHSTALSIREKYPDVFNEYFSFAVIRDPESRFLSAFSYLIERSVHPALGNKIVHEAGDIDRFVEMAIDDPRIIENIVHFWPQHRFVCDENHQILVNRLLRFETLDSDWGEIARQIRIEAMPLRRENTSATPKQYDLSDSVSNFVRKYYKSDYGLIQSSVRSPFGGRTF